jgi:hypothetical protein
MRPLLREGCDAIGEALAKVGPEDVMVRYRLGALVRAAQGAPDKYGKGAVNQIASCLAFSPATLYRFAEVAGAWTLEELTALLTRRGCNGLPLRWMHLVFLASVAGPRREELVQKALDEGMSPTALEKFGAGAGTRKKARLAVVSTAPSSRTLRSAAILLRGLRKWEHECLPELAHQTIDLETAVKLTVVLAAIDKQAAKLRASVGQLMSQPQATGDELRVQ